MNGINNNQNYYIAVFKSKTDAIRLYYNLTNKGYSRFKLISTPCRLAQGCSYSIKFDDLKDLSNLLKEEKNLKTLTTDIYFINKENGKKSYKRVSHLI